MMVSKPRIRVGFCALLFALAALVLGSCIHHSRPAIVAYTEQNKLFVRGDCPQDSETCEPFKAIEADRYASEQYDQYRESGFISLRPDMRLRIVAPAVDRAGSATPPAADASPANEAGAPANHVQRNRDLLGHETVIYKLVAAGNGGALSVELDQAAVKKPSSGATPARRDLLEGIPDNVWLRLYFQFRGSMKAHTAVLLFANTQAFLNEASGAFEEDPDAFCAAPHGNAHCLVFPQSTVVTAEVKIRVHKRDIYVPISATVRDALAAYGEVNPEHVAPHLKIERLWAANLVPVRFEEKTPAILSMPVVAGDRISW